jgi:hypothetical protein
MTMTTTTILVLAHITVKFCFWFLLIISVLPLMYEGRFGIYIQRFSLNFIKKASFFQTYCIIFFSYLIIGYAIDCSIITIYIDYGFPNINFEHFSDNFSFSFSGEISSNNVITESVNNTSTSGTISDSTTKTTSTLANSSTPATSADSSNSSSSTSNNTSSNQNNQTLHKSSSSSALVSNKAADAAIMTSAIAASKFIIQKAPNLQTKVLAAGSSIMLGASAIVAKNIASNMSSDIGLRKNKLTNLGSSLAELFDLTGNSVTDLLVLIKYMQSVQITILCFTLYYFILFNISEDKIEFYLMKILPTKIVVFIIKNLKLVKKTGFILLIIFLLLSIIAGFLVLHYLDFFLINFDAICDYYINNKSK